MPELNITKPIDELGLRPLFEEARRQLIEKEFPDGKRVDLDVFMTETEKCLNEGGLANLVSAGGLVESAVRVQLQPERGIVAHSSRPEPGNLTHGTKIENLLGATLYDRMRKRLNSLILETESHEEVKATP